MTDLYCKTALQPMRPYETGEDLTGVSVNAEDTPEPGGMIAWNPANPNDKWYVGKKFFADNYQLAVPTMTVVKAPEIPSIGRTVHYVAYGTPGGEYVAGAHRAAIVTEVNGTDTVGLCVLNPNGMFFNRVTPFSAAGRQPGTWHWPERV